MIILKSNFAVQTNINLSIYNTFHKRLKGLMFRMKHLENEGIWLIPCNSIHMFFMFITIDVVFLNKDNEIEFLKSSVKPWTIITPIKNAHSALELPEGTIKKYNLEKGDRVST